jgi:hypothetical protein
MSDFLAFLPLGFSHIVALGAADHILFLLALAAIYRGRDWKAVLWVTAAFTVGHSLTLALAVTNVLQVSRPLVEFLIPVTILLTALENIVARERTLKGGRTAYRPVFAGVFGLVHGAGFAGYLHSLFVDEIAMPLLGFNVGIELGQIVVLAAAFGVFWAIDRGMNLLKPGALSREPFHLRVVGVSAVVMMFAAVWAVDRWPY